MLELKILKQYRNLQCRLQVRKSNFDSQNKANHTTKTELFGSTPK